MNGDKNVAYSLVNKKSVLCLCFKIWKVSRFNKLNTS